MMNFQELVDNIGPLKVSSSPYDTAWLARLDGEIGKRALRWIKENQLPNGSWGNPPVVYHHDQVVCTLSAITALLQAGTSPDSSIIRRAIFAVSKAIHGLDSDHCGATVGFELIVPSLLSETDALGVNIDSPKLDNLLWARSSKLSALPDRRIDRRHTPSFSAEAVGQDHLNILDADNLQSLNGSVAFSPSATAFFAHYVKSRDESAMAYLRRIVNENGSVPYVGPIEVFDRGWALWNLSLLPNLGGNLETSIDSHIKFLIDEWEPGKGIASAVGLPLLDGDDTGIVFAALRKLGCNSLDVEAVLSFQAAFNFKCYPLESDPSTSTNVHILDALRQVLPSKHEGIQTALRFLRRTRTASAYWLDKWHISPYYPTSHAIIALNGLDDQMVIDAVNWILATQRKNGAWGWYLPTAEETAYALQALILWSLKNKDDVPRRSLLKGYEWLMEHTEEPYPPLWIGKCLYAPKIPVKAAILCAQMLARIYVCS
jgi:halimadienyl-diphosphate synthase